MRTDTFLLIAQHDHTGSGSGTQIATAALADNAVTGAKIQLANNEYLEGLNSAASAVNIIRVNSSDLLDFGTTISDDAFTLGDNTDGTKALVFSLGGATTAKTATIISSHSDNRSLTLPDATDTLVGRATTDTLTNKSIDSDNNTITNIVNADIKAAAAIALNKLAAATASRALVSDVSGFVSAATTTATEIGYVNGVTSAIQTQLDTKTDTGTTNEITLTGTAIGLSDDAVLPGTGSVTVPAGTTAQRPGSPSAGMLRYNSSSSKFEGYTSAWGDIGGGGGGINYIEADSDAEAGVGNWSTYADSAGVNPVDGTGGSATTTFTQNSTTPLRDSNDYKLTKDAANRQGEGASIDFTLDRADLASVMEISFDYDASDSDYVDGDVRIVIYDKDGTAINEMVPRDLAAGKGSYKGYFQSDSTNDDYRLILHISSTNANAYDLYFDNFRVGPATRNFGPVITEWKNDGAITIGATTTAPTKGTTSVDKAWYRRVGDSLEVRLEYAQSGGSPAAGSGDYLLTIPNSLSIDTDKVQTYTTVLGAGNAQPDHSIGTCHVTITNNAAEGTVSVYSSTQIRFHLISSDDASGNSLGTFSSAFYTFSSDPLAFGATFKVPIEGWDTQVQMSDDADTREVYASGAGNGGTSITALTTNVDFTETSDSHGAWSGSVFTAPSTGRYAFHGMYITTAANTGGAFTYVNGSQEKFVTENGGISSALKLFSGIQELNKGDTFAIRLESSLTLSNDTTKHYINIQKQLGPSAIAANELVAASYNTNAGQSIANNSNDRIDYEDVIYDTHGAVTTGASWVFTAPISGKYFINAIFNLADTADFDDGERLRIILTAAGSVVKQKNWEAIGTGTNVSLTMEISDTVDLSKGDTVYIEAFQNTGGAVNLITTATHNKISIHRVGF